MVTAESPSYPSHQRGIALDLVRRFGFRHEFIASGEMSDQNYTANPSNRCYFCKSELWTRLGAVARERGMATVIDGTNADDLGEHRPGLGAASERGIRSPLAELGWTKAMVRDAARELGIPVWDAPAAPCLSSRIRYGLGITPGRLRQVELGEAYLRSLGVTGDLRVRHRGESASIEAEASQMGRLSDHWPRIEAHFVELGFERVELDRRGYRRGSLLEPSPLAG